MFKQDEVQSPVETDFDEALVDVQHAQGVLSLVYVAIEAGEIAVKGRLDAGTVAAAIRAGIIAAGRAAKVLDAATAGGRP